MFDKILRISLLYDFYGQLLTEKQQEIIQLYYSHDLSLGEISEQLGVSRQAVYDTIKRTEKILFEYEEKLGLVQKFAATNERVEKIVKIVEEIEKNKHLIKSKPDYVIEEMAKIKKIANEILEK
ncbi:YlxM family DNA-binding protein [Thermotalea metallivorans]|uniref:UPF0122 protein AN619_00070 n=1 Tax=Thermotalea metallivorans TaxID=520762 RepID=A0A140LEN3_9FIRM|nr:putative DNA-binding protein [Thermotalea metallivorans]KXG79008.1 hypothetical protein AN619_00070 [Thermotalea metallivorans]